MRIVQYLNQFFAGVGGEDAADSKPFCVTETTGPGKALTRYLADDDLIVATVACGDSYFAENIEIGTACVLKLIRAQQPDLVLVGPAFGSGRYGVACASIASALVGAGVEATVTSMHPENPGMSMIDQRRGAVHVVPTTLNARGMREALETMVRIGKKLASGARLAGAEEEGYLPRGVRKNVIAERTSASRAVSAILRRVESGLSTTEMPLPSYAKVDASRLPIAVGDARIALVTEAAIVPRGNPDRLESNQATHWFSYPIEGDSLESGSFETVHGGCDNRFMNEDPHRALPVDSMRRLERAGVVGELCDRFFVTAGATSSVKEAERIGREIAAELHQRDVHAVILTST